jgi:hypothetical protein
MKALLQAIQTQLKNDTDLSYISDTNIFITPDEDIIPIDLIFPALGLKDGPINRIVHTNLKWEVHYTVYIIVLQTLSSGETPIVGQTDPKIYGVLDIADDIHDSLNENLLSISGMEQAFSPHELESQTIGYKDVVIQRKRITYEYIKEEDRP